MATRDSEASPAVARGPSTRTVSVVLCTTGFCFLAGCASLGQPTERKAPVPQAIRDLTAEQSGNQVVLSFTVPTETIDRRPLPAVPTIEIYRSVYAAPGVPAPSPAPLATIPSVVAASSSVGGRFRYVVSLTAADFLPDVQTIDSYSVRARVSGRKESESSNVVQVPIYPAPEPINDLQAQIVQSAVELTWTGPQQTIVGAAPAIGSYHIYRASTEAPPPTSDSSGSSPSQMSQNSGTPALSSPLAQIAETSATSYRDTSGQLDRSYAYSVRAAFQVSGKLLESSDSNVVVINLHDFHPPSAPTGLLVVPGTPEPDAPAHLDLSWGINPETNVAGYNVYRSEGGSAQETRLNPELLPIPAFRDMNVLPGRRYSFTVTAVDRSGNESSHSASVEGGLPAEGP